MRFHTTKDKTRSVTFEQAVLKGLAADGELYLPVDINRLPAGAIDEMKTMSLADISLSVAKNLLTDSVPHPVLEEIINESFTFAVPVVSVTDQISILELFHGPTLSFKDFAARFMSRLMAYFVRRADKTLTVLVATSGDTGSAVARGFYQVPGIQVIILYPGKKISPLQEAQMVTLGENITALEVEGTFDDCQKLVKQAFIDPDLLDKLWLTSANSINIARLVPQSFYYFYAWSQRAQKGQPLVFSVPSGNFGNLTGGVIAKKMGLPIKKFIAATNANNVIPKYLKTGVFRPQPSQKTLSNAMDVGNPSNFSRIMDLYRHDLDQIKDDIFSQSFSDSDTVTTIKRVFENYGYILDPHTAVGWRGLEGYLNQSDDNTYGITLATAHPGKFPDIVENAIGEQITIPQRLSACLDRKKYATKSSKIYEDFKTFLLLHR